MAEANPPYRRSFKTPPVLHSPGSVLVQVKERRLSQRFPKASLAKGWASVSLSMLKLNLQGDGRAVSGGGASGDKATRVEPSGVGLVASQRRPRGAPQPVEHSGPGQLPVRAAPARLAAASTLSSRPAGRGVRARCLPAAWPRAFVSGSMDKPPPGSNASVALRLQTVTSGVAGGAQRAGRPLQGLCTPFRLTP